MNGWFKRVAKSQHAERTAVGKRAERAGLSRSSMVVSWIARDDFLLDWALLKFVENNVVHLRLQEEKQIY